MGNRTRYEDQMLDKISELIAERDYWQRIATGKLAFADVNAP